MLPVPRRPGPLRRRLAVRRRGRRARPPGDRSTPARRRARRSSCPSTSCSPTASPPTPTPEPLDGVDVPDGMMGLDIGPRTAAGLRRRSSPTPAPCSGTARWARSSSSRSPPARARSPRRSPTRPASTVVGGGDSAAALDAVRAGRPGHPPVDRRRRVARADRGQDAAGRGGAAHEPRAPTPLIAGNWKMHKTVAEAEAVHPGAAAAGLDSADGVDVAICPPFTALGGDGRLDARLAGRRCSPRTCTRPPRARSPARCRRRCWSRSASTA